ncbi:hypothetical protein SAMN05192550_2810 [Flavobacterium glycines]|uniref:Uncharacterized protein n=1 Tax=Flavobacterium glycines TaxID=551990 RepID=A0A1B9DSN3_9FLAO|nr:hypothetical protein [Flavobacterium glycines]OCB72709.1 hypothetical protein FBGL_05135 [Flavobacterium glycines]GEL11814.1 hypothetical protein FGL01_25530 [Flavobacterium glycines]SDJ80690.1 hypothetical protein SAMN05192550_2810 [Flavobacterium glycines]
MAQGQDKFGNPQVVVGLKDKSGSGYPKGFIEIGGSLFKITTSPSNKEGVHEWVTLTKMQKNRNRGFGGNNQKRGF